MPKGFCGRKANDFKALIEALGYKWTSSNGDDDIYSKVGSPYTIKIAHRNEDIPNGTADHVKRCLIRNGHKREDLLKWFKENGYGE